MDYRIWKYDLVVTCTQGLMIPQAAEILSVENQNGTICLWCLCDTHKEKEQRIIEIIGTGNPVVQDMGVSRKFIGTVLDGQFVWHVFERL